MHTVFLLGSGISIGAGMPRVAELTEQVLAPGHVGFDSQGVARVVGDTPADDVYRRRAEPVLELVDDLRGLAIEWWQREPTYEELASLANQLHDVEHEYESPALLPLVDRLRARRYVGGDGARLLELAGRAHEYIADTVCRELAKEPTRLDHLVPIVEACRRLDGVTIATLNHDLVLEAALRCYGMPYSDGFERVDADILRWSDRWDTTVRLLKLHGSIDWWDFDVTQEPWRGGVTCRFQAIEGSDVDNPNRAGFDGPRAPRPVILTGTFDKILAYETAIFRDQHFRLHEALRETSRVVVIGYGFGDKAINARLIAFLAGARSNSLVVAHARPDELSSNARPAIRRQWVGWKRDGQLIELPAHIEDLDYGVLAANLGER